MTAARDLALARQRNYQLIIDTTLAWSAEKAVTPWAKMYRVVTAAVARAGGVVFADTSNPDQVVAAAAVRSFLGRVPTTGSIIADVQSVDSTVTVADAHETRARDIIDHWDKQLFVADLAAEPGPAGPKGDPGPAGTLRGAVWLTDLPGTTPADKLRRAWTPGSQDRRPIVVPHGTTIDAGATPIPVPAGVTLMGPGGPQTEFSDHGRVNVRATGGTAVFRCVDSGSNFNGTKGWSFVNLGFEGDGRVRLFAPNPMNASGPIMAYATIDGCSFDGFSVIIESPMLGCTWDIRYFNNITGPAAFILTGSDNQLWTQGGKGDWGQSNSVGGRRALIVFSGLEKSTVGGVYLTGEGSACVEVEGGATRGGLDIFGMTCEGRNANEPSLGAVVRVKGAHVNFFGGNFNYASGGAGDKAFVDVSGGRLKMFGSEFRRGNSPAPFVARRGNGKVHLVACTDINGNEVAVTNL